MKQPLVHLRRIKLKEKLRQRGAETDKKAWKNKFLHGRYLQRSQKADIDQANPYQWSHSVGLKAKTEGFILTAQDQSFYSRNYQAIIIKNRVDPKCKMCD